MSVQADTGYRYGYIAAQQQNLKNLYGMGMMGMPGYGAFGYGGMYGPMLGSHAAIANIMGPNRIFGSLLQTPLDSLRAQFMKENARTDAGRAGLYMGVPVGVGLGSFLNVLLTRAKWSSPSTVALAIAGGLVGGAVGDRIGRMFGVWNQLDKDARDLVFDGRSNATPII